MLRLDAAGVTYRHGRRATVALHPTDLSVHAGEAVALVGRSGAGKTTLAELALGLRRPTTGRVLVAGQRWADARRPPRRRVRGLVQGVPQDAAASLPPAWTVRRTLTTAARRLVPGDDAEARADRAAATVRLDPALLDRRPAQLSGGQAQRAALARALVADPALLVADEPTSALDPATAAAVSDELLTLARSDGRALLLVTHDPDLAARCDRQVLLTAGHAVEEGA
ncbi:ATP-binding cassette domain-containing protein [Cellulomonas sp. SLBN-39]|uniref:ATP-binding cassette domain-containing protein n=1 Tax=Cellulomonas sp. SLBN-39 TaxID=2768446 RepID=UPI00114F28CA|nr:ATP-binding cassette domain-containing protein [Cellulomonas sp. SLBN-39]